MRKELLDELVVIPAGKRSFAPLRMTMVRKMTASD
jgi:hypothetical protein